MLTMEPSKHDCSGTPTVLSQEAERFEIIDGAQIKVTSADGREEVVSGLVLTCPIPDVSEHRVLLVVSID